MSCKKQAKVELFRSLVQNPPQFPHSNLLPCSVIVYEFPLVEKVRTMLRLEDLFDKAIRFVAGDSRAEHDVALMTVFQIMDVAARADLKVDLLQGLERQRQVAAASRDAGMEASVGGVSLDHIEAVMHDLQSLSGRAGQHIRENEWLMTVRGRTAIPGGACEFDLPSYHYWLGRDEAERRADLQKWLGPMLPLHKGIVIVLAALRRTGTAEHRVADRGNFQWMLGGRVFQLARMEMAKDAPFIPELSANRYALMIRFLHPDASMRMRPTDRPVPFHLCLCNL